MASLSADVPLWSRIGFLGVIVAYLGIALYSMTSLVWVGSADSYFHLDYAYQIWHGDLPAGYGSELTLPGFTRHTAGTEAFHYTASHPPLFYALVSPIVGPLVDSGHWQAAVFGVRLVNLGIGLAILVVLAHFAWQFGGKHRGKLVVALPAMVALVTAFLNGASDVYNDMLVTLFAVLTLTISAHVIRDGLSARLVVALGIVCAAGMATKSTFIVTMAIAVGVVALMSVLDGQETFRRRLMSATKRVSVVVGIPVIAIGWFYAWNVSRSGSPFRASPAAPIGGRSYRSLLTNLTDVDFYLVFPRGVMGTSAWDPGAGMNWMGSLAMVGAGLVVWAAYAATHRERSGSRRVTGLLVVVFSLQVLGHYVAQLEHATGYGALNFRYFLPAVTSIGLVLSVGWVCWGRLTAVLIPIQMMILIAAKIFGGIVWLAKNHYPLVSHVSDVGYLTAGSTANGVPAPVPWLFLALAFTGCVIVAEALSRSHAFSEAEAPTKIAPVG